MVLNKLHKFSWLDLVLLAGLGLIVVGLGMSIRNSSKTAEVEIIKRGKAEEAEVDSDIMVDIAGEVIKPGVYKLRRGMRINDGLAAAGGLSAGADREWVEKSLNRAELVYDGLKIYIPKQGEVMASVAEAGGKISINRSGLEELNKLTGIGPALAQRIIDYREKMGGFKNVEEIKAVSGIGEKMYEKIKDEISL